MQRRQQKVKCEDTLRPDEEQVKHLLDTPSTSRVVESGFILFCRILLGEIHKRCKRFVSLLLVTSIEHSA
jgi:hypothetical protein